MTDRVEIKPDSNEKTLEQSAEDLKKTRGHEKEQVKQFREDVKNLSLPQFNKKYILDWFDAMASGKVPYNSIIWRFIAFGSWLKKYNVEINQIIMLKIAQIGVGCEGALTTVLRATASG